MKCTACWILPIALSITACAGVPREDGGMSELDRYMAYTGEPVDRISQPQRLRGWHPIDREHLYVRTDPTSAYLLTVAGGCIGLKTTRSFGITTTTGRGVVTSALDEVRLDQDRCRIMEIRPLDLARMQEDER